MIEISSSTVRTNEDDATATAIGAFQLPTRGLVGRRAQVLAGVTSAGLAAPGLLAGPTLTSFSSVE